MSLLRFAIGVVKVSAFTAVILDDLLDEDDNDISFVELANVFVPAGTVATIGSLALIDELIE